MTETDKTPRWKPIAEAPKDGTPVLLYLPDANDPQMDIGLFSDGEWLREFSFSTIDVEPTHFMDLPPAPGEVA